MLSLYVGNIVKRKLYLGLPINVKGLHKANTYALFYVGIYKRDCLIRGYTINGK